MTLAGFGMLLSLTACLIAAPLGLEQQAPDITTWAPLVQYSYASGGGTLYITGSATEFNLDDIPPIPDYDFSNATQTISLTIDPVSGAAIGGTMTLTGAVTDLTPGPNLLTGNILRFGFTEPTLPDTQVSALLEFEFTTTGGDLAPYFGSRIQMILDPALTYGASPFAASFDNSASRSSAAADTFSTVPTPAPFIMGVLGLAGIIARRRR